jgi:hypothetical protein
LQILHRIAFVAREADLREIDRLGVKLHPTGLVPAGFISFDASESAANWPAVREWLERTGFGEHWVRTVFTKQEIDEARWLNLQPDWHHGYPQPDDDFGYTRTTYDPSDYCTSCGVGGHQKAPFVMAGEPKWGTRSILQLNWVFDEYFVTPEVAKTLFEPFGIGSRPVLNRRGSELQTAVQLIVDERVSIRTDGLASETCSRCGRVKYLPISRGPLPALVAEPVGHMARTNEVFGSGGRSFNAVIVTQALARAIRAAGVKGVSFRPVASTNTETGTSS